MPMSADSPLVIFRHPPYGSILCHEGLDVVFAYAAFDHPPSILFQDDGVLMLLRGQQDQPWRKNLEKNLGLLGLYDIRQIYACEASLSTRHLSREDLCIEVELLDLSSQIRSLYQRHRTQLIF